MYQPLADALRPLSLDDVCGQEHILGENGLLRRIVESGNIPNMIFYGPSGTGLLLCGRTPKPLLYGGTGGDSLSRRMPEYLPDRGEAGTANVPGFAGLAEGMARVAELGAERIGAQEADLACQAGELLKERGFQIFSGPEQAGVVSFRGEGDCEELGAELTRRGIALRAGLHCAPLAHESAGTLDTGTVRLSFGWHNTRQDLAALAAATEDFQPAG